MYYPFLVYPIFVDEATFHQLINPCTPYEGSVKLQAGQSSHPACIPYGRQQYPEVDPTIFHQSAESFLSLMDDGKTLLTKLSESQSFAAEVMDAAQQGDKEKVKQLMESTGIQGAITTQFNPDSLTVTLYSDDEEICCKLSMGLQWK